MLYITTGDGTTDSDTNIVGQDMSTLLAKVLRIDVDHPDPGKAYSVPKDNPFVDMKGARPEIWSLGFRNPWRMCVDKKTGHLWVGQNGQDLWEQAYLVKKGDNAGWSVTEGSHPFYPNRKQAPVPIVKPTVEHHHSEARSLTGGLVYYGKKYPDLVGHYIYGDYSTGKIWAVKHDGDKILSHKEICDTRLTITGFGADSQGEILIADFQKEKGGLYTLVPTPAEKRVTTFPKKLSESGLFKSVKGHVMEEALIPYSVNAVLWSDGAAKQRWLGLPEDAQDRLSQEPRLGVSRSDGDREIVLHRHGGRQSAVAPLDRDALPHQARHRMVRLLLCLERRADRRDADRGEGGRPRIRDQDERRASKKLNWHYPSRAECMVCHSRAANCVLGFSELQMNQDHDYGGVNENQLPSSSGWACSTSQLEDRAR